MTIMLKRAGRFLALLPMIALALLLAACGKDPQTPAPPPPTVRTITAVPATATLTATDAPTPTEIIRRTLPPSWTPLPSATPIPPRATRTPTLSPTPIPTLTAKQICDNFMVLSAPTEGLSLDYDASTGFAWRGVPEDAVLSLVITQHSSGAEAFHINVPVAGDSLLNLSLSRLPTEGQYDWKIWLQHTTYGAICAHTGTFTRKPPKLL